MYTMDPTIVRMIAVFGTVATGIWPGVVAYLVGWFLIPEKDEMPAEWEVAYGVERRFYFYAP